MAVQRIVLIHPRELEIPKMEDICVAAVSLKAFPEGAKKVAKDIEKQKITPEKVSQDFEDIQEDVLLMGENNTGMNTTCQKDISLLKSSRKEWLASREFESQILEDKEAKIIKTPTVKFRHLKVSPVCPREACFLLADLSQCAPHNNATMEGKRPTGCRDSSQGKTDDICTSLFVDDPETTKIINVSSLDRKFDNDHL